MSKKMRKHQKIIHEILKRVFAWEYITSKHFKNELEVERNRVFAYMEEHHPDTKILISTEFSPNPNCTFKQTNLTRYSKAYKHYPPRIVMKDTLCKSFWNKEIFMKDYVRDFYQDHVTRIEDVLKRKQNAN